MFMHKNRRDPRAEFIKASTGFVSLLGSGIISALGFVALASNRFVTIDSSTAVFIILFVQWQTLGLTIAKTGIEQVVFAMVTEDENTCLNTANYVFGKSLPLAIVFSLIVAFVFSLWPAIVALCTIVLDTYSLIVMADLNARKRFKTTAISNLLNYPLFFALIFGFNYFYKLNASITLVFFLLSSFVRWLWLQGNQYVNIELKKVAFKANLKMGIQQVLNYVLFRADQLILAVVGLKMSVQGDIGMYVFIARFQELASGVMVIAGTVLFPKFYVKYPFRASELFEKIAKHAKFVSIYVATILISMYFYVHLWKGQAVSYYLMLPFLIQTMCILFVNNITYSALRQGYLRRLIINMSFAVLVGLLVSAVVRFNFTVLTLAWVVPIQILTFIIISLFMKWGNTKNIFVYE